MKSAVFALATISLASAVKLEREPLAAWSPTPKGDAFKMNYFVPHFGEDDDIKATKISAGIAEKAYNHFNWPADPADDPKRDYFVPHFGEDEDIEFSKRNIANAEKAHGAWNVKRDGNGAWILPSVESN